MLDRRVTPTPAATTEDVLAAAVALRRAAPNIDCSTAAKHLVDQFGKRGELSESTFRRIWSAAGLTHPDQGDVRRFEKVETFYGGGCLALIGAAALETDIIEVMAHTAIEAGRVTAATRQAVKQADKESREAAIADHSKHYRTNLPGTYTLKGYFSGSDREGKPDYTGTVKIWETGRQMSVEWTWANGGAQGVGMLDIPCYHEGQEQQVIFP